MLVLQTQRDDRGSCWLFSTDFYPLEERISEKEQKREHHPS